MSNALLLQQRIKKLQNLSSEIDNDIAKKRTEGYRDAPKFLVDLKKDVADQIAVCEAEKKNFQDGEALWKEIKKPGKSKQEIDDGNARLAELKTELDEIVKNNAGLHKPVPGKQAVADPCINCLVKKATEQNPAKHFVKFNVVDSAGKPRENVSFQVELPDGNTKDVVSNGKTVDIMNIEPGNCKIEFKWYDGVTVHDALIVS